MTSHPLTLISNLVLDKMVRKCYCSEVGLSYCHSPKCFKLQETPRLIQTQELRGSCASTEKRNKYSISIKIIWERNILENIKYLSVLSVQQNTAISLCSFVCFATKVSSRVIECFTKKIQEGFCCN